VHDADSARTRPVGRPVYGKLRFAAFDDAALAGWNLADAADKGMRVVAFVVFLGLRRRGS
jgi:hypothetical protein